MVDSLIVASLTTCFLKTRFREATEAEICAAAMEKMTVSVIDQNGAIV